MQDNYSKIFENSEKKSQIAILLESESSIEMLSGIESEKKNRSIIISEPRKVEIPQRSNIINIDEYKRLKKIGFGSFSICQRANFMLQNV